MAGGADACLGCARVEQATRQTRIRDAELRAARKCIAELERERDEARADLSVALDAISHILGSSFSVPSIMREIWLNKWRRLLEKYGCIEKGGA